MRFNAFGIFLGSHDTIQGTTKLSKMHIPMHFWSHSTIYTFKNYFATVFLIISFQFSANK